MLPEYPPDTAALFLLPWGLTARILRTVVRAPMGTRTRILTTDDLARPFHEGWADQFPPILSPSQLANLLGLSPKTVYAWIAQGRLHGSFRKRGKHLLIWRDKVLDLLFNGPSWRNDREST